GSAARALAALAANTACAVPRRWDCTNVSAPGMTRMASAATVWLSGPTTTAVLVPPASRTASSTCPSSDRPAISCSTLGRRERMRVPSPAASTIARQLRSAINPILRVATGARAPSYRSTPTPKSPRCGSDDGKILLVFSRGDSHPRKGHGASGRHEYQLEGRRPDPLERRKAHRDPHLASAGDVGNRGCRGA